MSKTRNELRDHPRGPATDEAGGAGDGSEASGVERLNEAALEEAALALMQDRGGPGEPRRREARVAVEAYLRRLRQLGAGDGRHPMESKRAAGLLGPGKLWQVREAGLVVVERAALERIEAAVERIHRANSAYLAAHGIEPETTEE